jgi:hypothetical protein
MAKQSGPAQKQPDVVFIMGDGIGWASFNVVDAMEEKVMSAAPAHQSA